MPAARPGKAWLSELPDDLLVLCIDNSMRLGALLSMTSIALATRIRHAARRGLRLVCKCPWQAFEGACKLQVRELVLTQPEFFVTSWKGLWEWLHDMHMVHRVLVNPDLADNVKRLYMSGNENAYTLRSIACERRLSHRHAACGQEIPAEPAEAHRDELACAALETHNDARRSAYLSHFNWSVYGQIKTRERSRMGHAVGDKLVYCHEALHLQNMLQKAKYQQKVLAWDTDSDEDETDEEDLTV